MNAHIAATVYVWAGLILAFVLAPAHLRESNWRVYVAWGSAAAVLFGFGSEDIVLLLGVFVLLALAPISPVKRIAFYLATVPFLPGYLNALIPFPGINYLAVATPVKISAAILLLPLMFKAPPRSAQPSFPAVAWAPALVAVYIVITGLLFARDASVTVTLRFLADQLLFIALPFFAIWRHVKTEADLEECLVGYCLAATILGCLEIVAAAKNWNFYNFGAGFSVFLIPELRGGVQRISLTTSPHSLGFHLATGMLLLIVLRHRQKFALWRLASLFAVMLAGIYVTGSRGSVAALVAGAAIYYSVSRPSRIKRWVLLSGAAAGAALVAVYLMSAASAQLDPYGTILYRQKLVAASLTFLQNHLWLGDTHFLADPIFADLVQGQGIIDITNLYLQIALQYGLIGLVVLFSVFFATAWRLLKVLIAQPTGRAASFLVTSQAALLGALVGWLAIVATTSDYGLTMHLGMSLLGLGQAALRIRSTADVQNARAEWVPPRPVERLQMIRA